MLNGEQRELKKQELLLKCFELFVKQGLENTSFNELAAYCDVHKSTMYSYLESKNEIVIECAKMHMLELDNMFSNAFRNPPATLEEMLRHGFGMIVKEKSKLRFVYQVVSSPLYGELAQKELSSIYMRYIDYCEVFAKIYNLDKVKLRPYFLLFISTMHDYCMWGNEILVKEKLDFIFSEMDELETN